MWLVQAADDGLGDAGAFRDVSEETKEVREIKMIETKTRCDHCGKQALQLRYAYTRDMDAAGSMETNYKTVDLCHEQAILLLQNFLQAPPAAPSSSEKENFARSVAGYKWKPSS